MTRGFARLGALLLSLGMLPAADAAEHQWRFALEEIEGSVQHTYAQRFAELMAERTDGAVSVNVYPYGQLGSSEQLTELVQSGGIQFAFASPGHLGSVVPEVQLFVLHFLFSDDPAANQRILSDSPTLYGPMAEAYRDKGLELLAVIQEGWMVWTADRALRKPSDFDGLKLRTMVSPLLLEAYKAYGANPTPMPYSEVYSALQLNTIDGQVNPVFAIEEMKFYEHQQYMTFANHLPFVASVVTQPGFFQGLSDELRATVKSVIDELDSYIYEQQAKLNERRLENIRQAGGTEIVRLSDSERAAFAALAEPVRRTYVEEVGERGQRILEAIEREVKAAEEAVAQDKAGND